MANFPNITPGANVIPPGTYGRFETHGLHGASISASAPGSVVITADAVAGRLNDGCSDVLFDGILWRLCGRAVWATGSDNLRWKRCRWERCGAEAWIGGALTNSLLEDCEAVGPHDGPKFGTSAGDPSKRHAYYDGYGGRGNTFRRCVARNVTGAGFHLNGTTDETGRYQTNCTLDACQAHGCSSSGTGGIDLDCTRDSQIVGCLVAGCRGGITLAGNGQESGQGSRNIRVAQSTVYQPDGLFVANVAEDSEGPVFEECLIACGPGVDLYRVDDNSQPPAFRHCVLVGVAAGDYPGEQFDGCEFHPWGDLARLLPGAAAGDYAPAAGVQVGWRPGNAPPPAPVVLPDPMPGAVDLPALARRVAELERDFDGLTARVASLERG